jgi:hypothetical protein
LVLSQWISVDAFSSSVSKTKVPILIESMQVAQYKSIAVSIDPNGIRTRVILLSASAKEVTYIRGRFVGAIPKRRWKTQYRIPWEKVLGNHQKSQINLT